MKRFPNIEKSGFSHRQYVGYSAGSSWLITGCHGNWDARKQVNTVGKTRMLIGYTTLQEISDKLTEIDAKESS